MHSSQTPPSVFIIIILSISISMIVIVIMSTETINIIINGIMNVCIIIMIMTMIIRRALWQRLAARKEECGAHLSVALQTESTIFETVLCLKRQSGKR